MQVLKYTFFTLIFLLISCSTDNSTDNNNPGLDPSLYYEELNIAYGSDNNQKFDLYLPANRSVSTKVIILVHGGGWVEGDKADMNYFKNILRQELPNLAIVNMNYRLADENNLPLPMQTDDITTVINTLKNNQANFDISDNFGFIGVSAGGHLSLLWSYAFDVDSNVKMVCSVVGPTNLADPEYTENPIYDPLFAVFGELLTDEFLEDASPYHRVNATASPTILFYGGQDPLVPTSQGVDLDAKLTSLEVTHEFTLYPNEGHGWTGTNLLDTWVKLKAFMEIHL